MKNDTALGAQAHLMPRFRALGQRDREQAAILAREIERAHTAGVEVKIPGDRVAKAEPAELRGIPCYAYGVGGVIRGTQPEAETVRRMSLDRWAA